MAKLTPEERSALGRLGGRARAQALTPERRQEIAKKAGKASWAANRTRKARREVIARLAKGRKAIEPERRRELARHAQSAWRRRARMARAFAAVA